VPVADVPIPNTPAAVQPAPVETPPPPVAVDVPVFPDVPGGQALAPDDSLEPSTAEVAALPRAGVVRVALASPQPAAEPPARNVLRPRAHAVAHGSRPARAGKRPADARTARALACCSCLPRSLPVAWPRWA
jgi:hypothetical protein